MSMRMWRGEGETAEGESVDKTTVRPGFPALGWSGEEEWLEQDGNVCDKRNSTDFIVPARHTTRYIQFWSTEEHKNTRVSLFWEQKSEEVDVKTHTYQEMLVSSDVTFSVFWTTALYLT